MVMDDYAAFLDRKRVSAPMRGIKHDAELAGHLFPFQANCVDFSLRAGASGCFLDTGLGKTEVQLEWCHQAAQASNGRSLLLTPLAVAGQTKRRADKYGYEARVIRDQSDVGDGINIINYDRLDKIDFGDFGAVSLDEASILKSFTGKTTRALIDAFKHHRFRLVATATPAPNDHMELGNYADFLSVMAANEMLSRFFINDTSTASQEWRLKKHAETAFWDWMASWARMAEKPSDLGDKDDGFILPPYRVIRHRAKDSQIDNALADMFGTVTMSATTMHDIKRQTSEARAEKVAEIVGKEPGEPWILWCDTNYEADAIKAVVRDAIEVRGSESAEDKEEKIEAFATGQARIIIGKPSMLGLGLDWSHCARMAFVGRSYSYELWYQAVRRCWRYGQKRNLDVHLIVAEGEGEIGRIVDRKSDDHSRMKNAMRAAMARVTNQSVATKVAYNPTKMEGLPSWIKSFA
jgi:superfamily II DNA or RNA helicase